MAPVRVGQHKTIAEAQPETEDENQDSRFKKFDAVEDILELPRRWSVFVRVEVKFPVEPRYRDKQHFIFVDIDGSKAEAISHDNNVARFDNLLMQGCTYKMHRVVFAPNLGEVEFRNINHQIELVLTHNTVVEPYTVPVRFPPYPKHLMPFHKVTEQPNKTFVDIMGIVVNMQPMDHKGITRYREVVLMDARWDLIVVGFSNDHLTWNALRWEVAKAKTGIIIAIMLRHNPRHKCLESSDHTTLHFNTEERYEKKRLQMILESSDHTELHFSWCIKK